MRRAREPRRLELHLLVGRLALAPLPVGVEDVLERVQAGLDIGIDVDVAPRLMGKGGHNAKVKPGTAAADAMIGAVTAGYGQAWAAAFVSEELEDTDVTQPNISRATDRFGIQKIKSKYYLCFLESY